MLMPSVLGERLFDDWMDDFPFRSHVSEVTVPALMKTDIRETDNSYEVDIDMPGFKKSDIKVELKEGYLTIEASTNQEHGDQDKSGKYIRRERYVGTCSRSFYVGKNITEEDIKARFEDGILKLSVPKKQQQPKAEEKKYISIDG